MTDENRRTDEAGEAVDVQGIIPEETTGRKLDDREEWTGREGRNGKRKKPGRGRKGSRWKRWLRRIFTVLLALLVLSGIGYLILTHTPFYKELQETAYDTLATMDKGTTERKTRPETVV